VYVLELPYLTVALATTKTTAPYLNFDTDALTNATVLHLHLHTGRALSYIVAFPCGEQKCNSI